MKKVITFGTFDVCHVGHIRLLARAKAQGDHLTVGVSSDQLNLDKKGRNPIYSLDNRIEIIQALRCVDAVFVEESLQRKSEYIRSHGADVLVMGDDWQGKFDHLANLCKVIYLPRTPSVSTTEIIEIIREVK
ncbi:adenylyltransferase/cytidyltransferase family protein [Alteromonas oceanisediminis]|uniref:adenylyltransferase/cytidyltransferase family protein n=1 Tax=Alteromonas oceanisediminis TaxID=2836180 RepID=UPI001BDAC2A3|nr:adenylyltransferase/cytidyltransferase family protein [Alteromonas oceanisediminis]MBT0586753.1 adenylyltransferase/cytidyltransferase family protein [Alteromonas oceanisediminis]